jgi:hypothetical protein
LTPPLPTGILLAVERAEREHLRRLIDAAARARLASEGNGGHPYRRALHDPFAALDLAVMRHQAALAAKSENSQTA